MQENIKSGFGCISKLAQVPVGDRQVSQKLNHLRSLSENISALTNEVSARFAPVVNQVPTGSCAPTQKEALVPVAENIDGSIMILDSVKYAL